MKVDNKTSFLQRIEEKPQSQEQHKLALSWLYEQAKNLGIKSCIEYFGGVGVSSAIIEYVFNPVEHVIFEDNSDCIKVLKEKFSGIVSVTVLRADSLSILGDQTANHVSLDFGSFSLLKLSRLRESISKVFAHKPLFVDITDTSLSRLGLHKNLYSTISGCSITDLKSYILAYRDYVSKNFGYFLNYAAGHGNSFHFGFMQQMQPLVIARVIKGKVEVINT